MEDTITESQSRNAAKVAGAVAAVALTTAAVVKGVRFVGNKLKNRSAKHIATDE